MHASRADGGSLRGGAFRPVCAPAGRVQFRADLEQAPRGAGRGGGAPDSAHHVQYEVPFVDTDSRRGRGGVLGAVVRQTGVSRTRLAGSAGDLSPARLND